MFLFIGTNVTLIFGIGQFQPSEKKGEVRVREYMRW